MTIEDIKTELREIIERKKQVAGGEWVSAYPSHDLTPKMARALLGVIEWLQLYAIPTGEAQTQLETIRREWEVQTMSRRKPKTHEIKCWPQFFGPVANSSKPFEIRKNDRDYQIGDTLRIREWCPTKRDFTGYECRAIISYLTPWEQIKGNVVLGIRLLPQDAECSQLGEDFSKLPMCAK